MYLHVRTHKGILLGKIWNYKQEFSAEMSLLMTFPLFQIQPSTHWSPGCEPKVEPSIVPLLFGLFRQWWPQKAFVCMLNCHSRQWPRPSEQALLRAQQQSFISAKVMGMCPGNGEQCAAAQIKTSSSTCFYVYLWTSGTVTNFDHSIDPIGRASERDTLLFGYYWCYPAFI